MNVFTEEALRVSSSSPLADRGTSSPSSSSTHSPNKGNAPERLSEEGSQPSSPINEDQVQLSTRTGSQESAGSKLNKDAAGGELPGNDQRTENESTEKSFEKLKEELDSKLNKNLSLRFGNDETTGKDFFQIVEKDTGDVVRQFPPENFIDFLKKFNTISGLLFSDQA
jgi:flagellar protein FlaG